MAKRVKGNSNVHRDSSDPVAPAHLATLADAYSAEASSRNISLPTWTAISPFKLADMFRYFQRGEFYKCAPYFEGAICYDSHLKSCSDKRYGAISGLAWEIQFTGGNDNQDEEATRQRDALVDFFDTLRFSTIDRRDMQQSVSALIEWTIQAIAFGYSASAVEFFPAMTQTGIPTFHAHFSGVPLRYFEARERRLRLLEHSTDYTGIPIPTDGTWCIAVSPKSPLILASMILYMLKVTPLEDWAHAVERFGMPFVFLRTPAKKGDSNWNAATEAAKQIGSNFSGVFGKDVDIQVSSVAQGLAPHSALIDYLDRRMAILWRGGDVGTESRADADVGGVSLQGEEKDAITVADRQFVEETFDRQIVIPFLKRVFGANVKQKVYFRFTQNKTEDVAVVSAKLAAARDSGMQIPESWAYDVLGIPHPKDGEKTLVFPQAQALPITGNVFGNAKPEPEEKTLADAKNTQWEKLLEALAELNGTSDEAFPERLKALHEEFPEIAGEILSRNDVAEILAEQLAEELKADEGTSRKN